MAAQDNLGPQFSTWYHGTRAAPETADSIKQTGLTSSAYSGRHNLTLTTDKGEAGYFAGLGSTRRGASTVVTVHVPNDQLDEYTEGNAKLRGLKKPLPSSMIHDVENF